MTIDISVPARRRRGADAYDGIDSALHELAALAPDAERRTVLRDDIVRRCLPLADHIARRYSGRGESYDDLYQVASVGLVLAVDRFDPARGQSFLAFAVPTMMGEVRRHFRDHTWALRVPRRIKEIQQRTGPAIEALSQRLGRAPRAVELAIELGVDLNETVQALLATNAYRTDSLQHPGDGSDDSAVPVVETIGADDPKYLLTEQALTAGPLLDDLPDERKRLLYLRFFRGQTQSEIARQFGVSQMQISRLLTQTLSGLHRQVYDQPQ
ncbi:SigB/SigF/SigG family RNA polymerase sigma factor [Nocardia wallacei]|uniref:RNA polymerase sigma factor SigF n=1 Tax=Nocardia wallacei TaxID=480035 RepID=A0A7G1KQF2_9NOCA|nr:SigB/SigF/SigG family RNA polymerase sigma factor [Nocardia wallacei]BCK56099.1 RNA polymerase sigma factor SigF [Nocardia wallacei]